MSVDSLNDKVQEKEVELQAAVSFWRIFWKSKVIFNWFSLSNALAYNIGSLSVSSIRMSNCSVDHFL